MPGADSDGDGLVQLQDLLDVIANWGSFGLADFDRSGTPGAPALGSSGDPLSTMREDDKARYSAQELAYARRMIQLGYSVINFTAGPQARRPRTGLDAFLYGSTNFFAGAADTISFGITSHIRGLFGWNDYVDTNSNAYQAGIAVVTVIEVVTAVGALKGLAKGIGRGLLHGADRAAGRILGRKGCFVAGTMVLTCAGLAPIESVRADDLVWTIDPFTGELTAGVVEVVHERRYDGLLVTFTIAAPNGDIETITATANHPFWIESGDGIDERPLPSELEAIDGVSAPGRWVDALFLLAGDTLLSPDGEVYRIIDRQVSFDRITVYNLTVRGSQNYFVGELPCLVHNVACSVIIRRNMLAVGRTGAGDAAHIIPAGMKSLRYSNHRAAMRLRKTLDKFGIDVNDAANGFYTTSSRHLGTHTTKFLLDLEQRLLRETSRDGVLNTLRRMADDWVAGRSVY